MILRVCDTEPDDALIMIEESPGVEPVTDIVDDPELRMLAGSMVAARPIGDERTRFTVPLNPLSAFTVTVEFPLDPARMVMDVGLVLTVKSWIRKVTVAGWDREPLDPVIVSV